MKSGSNTLHGDERSDFQPPQFQGNNVTKALAAPPNNLKTTNPLHGKGYYDYSFDVGGRILRDKLWFYGGLYKQALEQGSVSFFGAPDKTTQYVCLWPDILLLDLLGCRYRPISLRPWSAGPGRSPTKRRNR